MVMQTPKPSVSSGWVAWGDEVHHMLHVEWDNIKVTSADRTKLDTIEVLTPSPSDGFTLIYNAEQGKFIPATLPSPTVTASSITSGTLGLDRSVLGAAIVVDYKKDVYGAANAWPTTRPTARTDICVIWLGPTDPGNIAIGGDIIYLSDT